MSTTKASGVTEITLTANVYREDDDYVADCLEIGSVGQGATFDEAVNDLREATELLFEECPDTVIDLQRGETPADFIAGVRKLEQAYADYIGEPVEPVDICFVATVTFTAKRTLD